MRINIAGQLILGSISDGLIPDVDILFTYLFIFAGAIMFGDALLPSECSLIVEELKQTSLCFQVSGKLHFRKYLPRVVLELHFMVCL